MIKQRTLKSIVKTRGVGLHTGERVEMTMRPAQPDTGIVFLRADLPDNPAIPAVAHGVTDTRLSTCIEANGGKVQTIEHVMSALAGLGIDNCYIDLTGPEPPIVDGSAGPFIFLIQSAGIAEQSAPKRYLRVKKTVEVQQGDKIARFSPHEGLRVTFSGEFDHPAFADIDPTVTIDFAHTSYVREVARARTFGFTRDVEAMRAQGLGLGGSLENVIVLDEFRVLNADGLRYADEFLKHKILDAIGDIYLLGHPLIGDFYGRKSGHALNNVAARALLDDANAWELVTFDDPAKLPKGFMDAALQAG
ncbi:MAG: UDP-3-O-acyl-N-acetylglucosamine deacetylase [Pseudomonadota bacterium]|nr:UDP-3-O-acyl-N-acetylglucosamine deacetylase [Pseudomonadota bacterium]